MKRQTPISLLNRSEMRSATDALEDRLRECSEERKAAEVSPPFLLRLLPSPHPTSSPLPPSMTWNLKACVGGLRQLAQGLPTSENEGRKCEAGPGKSPADKPRPKSSGGEALAGWVAWSRTRHHHHGLFQPSKTTIQTVIPSQTSACRGPRQQGHW